VSDRLIKVLYLDLRMFYNENATGKKTNLTSEKGYSCP